MNLYRFDDGGVIETAFANDRDDLAALLVENFGAGIATLAEEFWISAEEYLAAWVEVLPSDLLTITDEDGYTARTRTVAEWTAEWMATEGKRGLFTSTEA